MVTTRSHLLWALTALGVLGAAELAHAQGATPFTRRSGKAFPKDASGKRFAFGDVDGDGDPDLLMSGKLLLNDGKGRFSWAKGSGLKRSFRAAVFLDYDQDGDLDVFATAKSDDQTDRMFRNDTKTTKGKTTVRFTDVTGRLGANLHDHSPGEGIGVGDVNGDGRPDIYVANFEQGSLGPTTYDRLYVSVGKTRYRDASNLVPAKGAGRGVSMADYDRDGDMDILVSNYRLMRNHLFVNQLEQTGSLRFVDYGARTGAGGTQRRGRWGHTIGSAWGDLDNDGDFDLLSANLAHPGMQHFSNMTQVLLNNPAGPFTTRESRRNGLGIKYEESHANPTLFDMDNDGDLDVHLTSVYANSFVYRNLLREEKRLRFRDITTQSKARTVKSWGAATADVDGDGDLDLVVSNGKGKPAVYMNARKTTYKSVRVRLVGRRSDTWGLGATARLTGGGAARQVRQLHGGHGTSSQSEPILHFGVGKSKGPYTVRVEWPSGAVSVRKGLTAQAKPYRIKEPKRGEGAGPWTPRPVFTGSASSALQSDR